MVPPVWTLLLLVGAAPFRKEKPPDQKLVVRSSRDNYVLTQCDFEDDAKPLCDWSQVSADDGDWVRASGPSPTGSTGAPGGYPNGEGSYLHMESNSFHHGGVARLRSPDLWEQGPLCVHFAYRMFGLSWGTQLRLLLLSGEEGRHPNVLWKHWNTQRPSWMPTTITVPAGFTLPTRLMFEGTRGSTAYLDIALDALSIRRGSCNRVCMMQTCSFDIPNDLCDWTWIPTASGAKWTQKKGSSGKPGVGPDGDFSSPGSGRYMLLDPKNARPGQKAVLLSPVSPSSGCLSFSFHYILRGQSPGAALHIYASVLGSIRKHTLFSGQPGPNWQAVSVNYTAMGRIQFAVVGVFGKTPEPAVAVDATSIAPCGEGFPQCDFEDNAHPFCDWVQTSGDGGHWALGHKNGPVHGMGPVGGFPNAGSHYIYLEADKFSQAGQSVRLVSRPFCAPGDICVEFAYHMYGLGEGTMLELLLGSPAGSPPIPLWKRVGSQRPYWQNTSITIPSGHQQPMQLIFKAIQGRNTAFVVAMGFILINPGTCPVKVLPELPPVSPVFSTGPSETTGLTENPTISTKRLTVSIEKPSVATEKPTVPKEKPTIPTEKPTIPTEKPVIPSEKPNIPSEKPTIPSEKPTILTEKPTIPSEKPTIPSEKPTISTEKPTVPREEPTTPTEETTIYMEEPAIPTEKPSIPTEKPTIPMEKPTISMEETIIPTEKPTISPEKPTIPTEKPTIPTEKPTVSPEKPTTPTEKPTIPTEKPTISPEKPTTPTEKPTISPEKPTTPTEKPTISPEKPTIPTEKPTIPTEKPTISPEKPITPTEKPTISTEEPTTPTEETTISTEEPAIPTEKPGVPMEKPTLSTEETTTSVEETTISTEKLTIPMEKPTISTEKLTIPTEKPTIPMEKPTISTEKPTISPEKLTIPTEKPTISPEKPSISTEKPTIPTEKPTIPIEETTISTEKLTIPTEKPTIFTEKPTIPMEKPTIPTEKPTIPSEKPTIPTEKPTIPSEKPTIPTEKLTIPTEKPAIPTEKPTIPTEKLTALRPPHPSPTATGLAALVMSPHAPSAPMTSVILGTTTTSRSSTERCPPNARYESCACPASCKSPRPSCGPLCRGGCVCNPGFLFSDNHCIQASSCNCFYNNNYYEPGAEWFSPNCTEHCRCWPGSRVQCQISQCGTHTVCQLKNGQYGCHPYGTATCLVYGDPHYVTFDGRHFGFMGKCTYILAQPCGNSTDPFFRVTAKNEEQGQEGMSCLSKVYVTLPETTVTLLKGRRTLVGGQRVTLPAIPSKGVFLGASGRFVELQTEFGLRVRWDGDQQLYVTVSSTYSGKLCGLCGNYDGNSDNDHLKSDGSPAGDKEELGNSWQTDQDEDQECQKNQMVNPPSCDSSLQSSMSGPGFCGRLVDTRGPFETCLLHVKATSFFDSCMLDMCRFQGLQHLLCAHMSTMTATCQDAGHAVKPWREPHFCPMACPPNSKYSLCAKPCPDTCHSGFSGMFCSDRCVEACECNPGFVLSGLECVPRSQCGCLHPAGSYFKVGERWYKPGCKELCVCESNNRIRCQPWRCSAQEFCGQQDGIYGCHAQGAATCAASGDPHYLTFDGALHHFMGTCTYVLTRPCWSRSEDSYFVVSATNENRGGNLEVSYIKAVHVTVFDLSISLLRGCKVMLNGHRVALPVWPAQGRVTIRLSSNFVLLYTNFGLQVRYDGSHLVEVTVPSSYGGQLCGLCGNYNNNSLDDNLRPDRKPAGDSVQLGAAWKLPESSEPGCFLAGGKPSRCQENGMADTWNKNCEILINPQGPFSQCHQVVPPQPSFASCVHGQCGTKGDTTALCRSLQTYASLCAQAGQAPAWRNRTFCPMRCPPGSSYSPCGSPCPATCSSINDPRDCPKALPCAESCECQKGHILSGTSCVPLGQCGCTDPAGSYHPVGERWYTENTCTRLCTCSVHNNITCFQSTCKPNQLCWALDGLLRCRASGMGVCQLPGESHYVSFDGSNHFIPDTCTHVLVKVCHPAMALPFFKISAKHEKEEGGTEAFRLHEVYIDIYDAQVTLQKGHCVLINSKQVTLPAISQIPGVSVKSSSIYTIVNIKIGVQVKFDGNRLLEIEIPTTYYGKVCGVCGNFNDEEEDELMMPSDELAHSDSEFVNSWKDKDIDPSCQSLPVDEQQIPAEQQENLSGNCRAADLRRAREKCEAALRAPVWAQCASRVDLTPFLVDCADTLCEFGGLHQALCQALQAFGATCQSQGLKPPLWRNSSFCPLECPAYSSYTSCLPSCSPSCWDLDGQCEGAKVPSACAEGCICQPGYVLSEDKCVPRSQCGCKDAHGGSIPLGKSWVSSGCTEKCVCTGGAIQCGDFRCPPGSHCQLSSDNSNSNCVSDKSEQCSVYGDPRYLTFDGFSYRFQGRMTYVLIKTVDVLPEGVEPLLVEGRNKMDPPRSSIFLQEVITTVYGYKVQLQAGLELVVNNQKMAVPYRPNEHLRVTLRGQRLYLVTDFELVVSFGGRKNAVISLPSMYEGLVRGLCGNYDENRKNDMMLPSGALTQNLNTFGNSWEVKTEDALLRFPRAIPAEEEGQRAELGLCAGLHVSECSPEQMASNSTQACRVLADPQGPFAACHQTVAPEPFQEHCMMDLCSAQDPREQEELRCQVLSGYAILCQEAGAALAGWRDRTLCAMECPAGTMYQSCMTPCPASCANLADPGDCEGPCVEGCASIPGYAYSGTQSLPWLTVAAPAMASTTRSELAAGGPGEQRCQEELDQGWNRNVSSWPFPFLAGQQLCD
ncbi:LOW QUALITY PROTEIN: zonadhesin [Pongo abelii]|uniref:LOW QUALITY PROTEIN: zonadhesin n=1 Tax=Pongo abelii TaxID=9601 RepID=UPI0023E86695|nr:LOW QUALITY PROTEIN: zonadhesin [Pongo abelii]